MEDRQDVTKLIEALENRNKPKGAVCLCTLEEAVAARDVAEIP